MAGDEIHAAAPEPGHETGITNAEPQTSAPTDPEKAALARAQADLGKKTPGPKIVDEEGAVSKDGQALEIQAANGSDTDSSFDVRKEDHFGEAHVVSDAKDLVTHVLHVDDNPELSPWTFRAFFLGEYCGTSVAGGGQKRTGSSDLS
jgi:hypothetical protein